MAESADWNAELRDPGPMPLLVPALLSQRLTWALTRQGRRLEHNPDRTRWDKPLLRLTFDVAATLAHGGHTLAIAVEEIAPPSQDTKHWRVIGFTTSARNNVSGADLLLLVGKLVEVHYHPPAREARIADWLHRPDRYADLDDQDIWHRASQYRPRG